MSGMVKVSKDDLAIIDPNELALLLKRLVAELSVAKARVVISLPVATLVIAPAS